MVSHLAALTGDLEPIEQSTAEDLALARTILAKALVREQAEPLASLEVMARLAEAGRTIIPQEPTRADLTAIAEQMLEESAREEPEFLVYRRELPVLTTQDPASLPLWADGRAIDLTLGPFRDALGRPIWIDLFRIVRQVALVRSPGNAPFLTLPIQELAFTANSFKLGPGSLWFASALLAAGAPVGGYTGLRIKGGTLTFSQSITITGSEVIVPPFVTCAVQVQLDIPATPGGTATEPGADAREAMVVLPNNVTLLFTSSNAAVQSADQARLDVYGTTVQLNFESNSPTYVADLNRILVPFKPDSAQFVVRSQRSTLFEPDGEAAIQDAAWALPVAVINPAQLGAASGAGALALLLDDGLAGAWKGQTKRLPLGPSILMTNPEQLSLTALSARGFGTQQIAQLWSADGTGKPTSHASLALPTPFPLRYISQASGAEALLVTGQLTANLDRPLTLDGHRVPLQSSLANVILLQLPTGLDLLIRAQLAPPKDNRKALAFACANIVMKSSPAILLALFGSYDGQSVSRGKLELSFNLLNLLPTLPDPYATNYIGYRTFAREGDNLGTLLALAGWAPNTLTSLSFYFSTLSAEMIAPFARSQPGTTNSTNRQALEGLEEERVRETSLANITGLSSSQGGLLLLDVSSNADWFGVQISSQTPRTVGTTNASISPFVVENMYLQGPGLVVQVVTVPEVQWEPVATPIPTPDDPLFPPLMTFPDSGWPSVLGVETVNLVPVAPIPALDQIIKGFNSLSDPQQVVARLTLPFGILAAARLNRPKLLGRGAELDYNRPGFLKEGFEGGRQVSIQAVSLLHLGGGTPGLDGGAIQLRNGLSNGLPTGKSVLDSDVDTIFNNNFQPGGTHPQVPVTRIDLSGYGESLFSDWRNPTDAAAIVSQVRFDVLVGRTAYEVVQVRSVLYPYAVRVIRTITIQRLNNSKVARHDSGWQAATDGNYQYPNNLINAGLNIKTHPGVVSGIHNVTNIRDIGQTFFTAQNTELMAVRFDGDVEIESVIKGGSAAGVPARDQLGFVQLTDPQKMGVLSPDEYAGLIAKNGPLGGTLDCLINIGGSGQLMRVNRVGVGTTQGMGSPEFVMTSWGSPLFPKGGQFSFLRQSASGDAPQPVDQQLGVPLIRAGVAPIASPLTTPYRFADPVDLATPDNPFSDYGILHATGTQRVFFPRPKIEVVGTATRRITSTQVPVLADPYTLATAVGFFPRTADAIPFPGNNWALAISAVGDYKLELPSPTFPVTIGQRTISNAFSVVNVADYANAVVEIALDTSSAVPWLFRLTNVSLVTSSGLLGEVMRVTGSVNASAVTSTQIKDTSLVLSGSLGPIQDIITFLQNLGLPAPLSVSMTNDIKFKVGLKIPLDKEINKFLPPNGPQFDDTAITVTETIDSPISESEFELGATLLIPTPFNPLKAVGLMKLNIKLSTKSGTTFTLTWGAGIGISFNIGPFEAKAYFVATQFLIVGDTAIGLGVGAIIKASVDILDGLISVDISVEFKMAVLVVKCNDPGSDTTIWGAAQVTFAIEITIFWVIDIDFEVQSELDQQLSGGSCPLPDVL